MEIAQIEAFLSVIEHGTVSGAARRMHLTQPAVSRRLQQLEQSLDVELFGRAGRTGMILTQAGRAFEPHARAMVEQIRGARTSIEQVRRRRYWDVRIGTVDSIATALFPKVVAPLRQRFPDLLIKFRTARTPRLREDLAAGALDLAIMAASGEPPGDGAAFLAGPYDLQFYGRADRFPELAECTEEEQVLRFPLVELESLPGQPTMISEEDPSYAVAGSLASAKALILAGFGVGSLLSFTLTPEDRRHLVRARVPHDPECNLWVCVARDWVGDEENRIAGALTEAVREAMK